MKVPSTIYMVLKMASPWQNSDFLFYNFLLSTESSCNGIITQSHSSKNKLQWKYILSPGSHDLWNQRGWRNARAVTNRRYLKRTESHCMYIAGTCWTNDHMCFISSSETAIFFLSPQCVQMLSQIWYFQPISIPSPQQILFCFRVDFSIGLLT